MQWVEMECSIKGPPIMNSWASFKTKPFQVLVSWRIKMIQIKGMVLIFEDMAEDNLPLPKIGGHPAYAAKWMLDMYTLSILVGLLLYDIPIQPPRMDCWQTPGRSQRTWWEIADWKVKIMRLKFDDSIQLAIVAHLWLVVVWSLWTKSIGTSEYEKPTPLQGSII